MTTISKNALEIMQAYCKREDIPFDGSRKNFFECLREVGTEVSVEKVGSKRHWIKLEIVKKFEVSDTEVRYIKYGFAETTGDMSIFDTGWEWEYSCGSIVEVVPKKIVIEKTVYEEL